MRESAGKAAQGTLRSTTEVEPGLTMLIFQMEKKPFPIQMPCFGEVGCAPSAAGADHGAGPGDRHGQGHNGMTVTSNK